MQEHANSLEHRLYRSDNGILFGVCAGLAEYFDLAPWGVRAIFIVLFLFFFPITLITYIILSVVLKKRPRTVFASSAEAVAWSECQGSRAQVLGRLQERLLALDKRLQRMESIVTRPGFGLEDEYRKL